MLAESPNKAALIIFDTDHAGGQKFAIGKGNVWGQLDITESAWTLLEPNSSSYHGGGEGDLAVWVDFGLDRLRGWAPDGLGVRTILESTPTTTCDVVPSPQHIVGYAPAIGGSCDGPSNGRIWYIPRSSKLVPGPAVVSPPLPGDAAILVTSYGIRSWGDFAVLQLDTFKGDPTYLLVVQLSTWKAWRVDAGPGLEIQGDSFALDDQRLYYGEGKQGEAGFFLSRMRRIILEQLGSAPNVTAQ